MFNALCEIGAIGLFLYILFIPMCFSLLVASKTVLVRIVERKARVTEFRGINGNIIPFILISIMPIVNFLVAYSIILEYVVGNTKFKWELTKRELKLFQQ